MKKTGKLEGGRRDHAKTSVRLHLVLVTQERYRVRNLERLGTIRDQSLRMAQKKGCALSRLAVLPDHVHAALRGNIELSPQDIALAFQNNLAYALGQCRLWQDTYYVGTFSEGRKRAPKRDV